MGNKSDRKFWPPTLTRELVYPDVPLFRPVEVAAEYFPEKTALNYYGREIAYRTLQNSVERLAAALAKRGVKRGDRVAVYLQNSPHYVISFYGVMRANAVVVPINPMWRSEELAFVIRDCGIKTLITTSDMMQSVMEIRDDLQTVIVGAYSDYLPDNALFDVPDFMLADSFEGGERCERWLDLLNEEGTLPPLECGTEDLCLLPYTSGSTGMPKGCMHTHKTVMANLLSSYHWMGMTAASVHLSALPFFHVTGLIHCLLAPLYAGSAVVILTRWNRNTALTAIEKLRCTHWINITAMVVDVVNSPDITARDLSSLLVIGGGGAPLPKAVGERLKEITGLSYVEGYGLTETISQTHFNPPHAPKLQCIGIPDFGVDARIVDVESLVELPANQQGELVIHGPEVFLGYWNRPKDNADAFMELDGKRFFRTGDICYTDDDGYFYIVDRTKRMINAAGFKVWPAEVESFLYRYPDVQEACVVGVNDPKRGEQVRAYIVLKKDSAGKVKPDDIIAWCSGQMAAYKYPRQIIFVETLPKSGTGKILWRELQEQANREAGA